MGKKLQEIYKKKEKIKKIDEKINTIVEELNKIKSENLQKCEKYCDIILKSIVLNEIDISDLNASISFREAQEEEERSIKKTTGYNMPNLENHFGNQQGLSLNQIINEARG